MELQTAVENLGKIVRTKSEYNDGLYVWPARSPLTLLSIRSDDGKLYATGCILGDKTESEENFDLAEIES